MGDLYITEAKNKEMQKKQLVLIIGMGLTLLTLALCQPIFAADFWGSISNLANDIYKRFSQIMVTVAGIGIVFCVIRGMFSSGRDSIFPSIIKILGGCLVVWGLGSIFAYIQSFVSGGGLVV